ncbi:MAG: hypothetical protein ABI175_20975, partial [Polyangiales bacterium]
MSRLACVLACTTVAACAGGPRPPGVSQAALFRDLEREVTVTAAIGWRIDRREVENLMNVALESVCRVDPLDRRSLATWLDEEIRRQGGPVEAAWRARGKSLSAVSDLLVLDRVQRVLTRAEELSLDCPFWMEPQYPFEGRQISDGHWLLTGGGGGKGIASYQDGSSDLKAGGAGRLLLGRVFEGGTALFVGAEIGISAAFPKNEMGERTQLEVGADIVTPIVYRRPLTTNFYGEVEGGWLGRTSERDWTKYDNGVHVGLALGARGLRTRFVFPGAGIAVSWERTFLDGGDA